MASITITGVDALIAKLGKAAAIKTLRPPMKKWVGKLKDEMQDYPPPPPASTYIRTGRLGREWTKKVTTQQNGLTGIVSNYKTPYGIWVQSQRFQVAIHRGRWQTDQSTVDKNRPAIVGDFQKAIDRALK